jgi:DNA-binding SARP family transcriptional activator
MKTKTDDRFARIVLEVRRGLEAEYEASTELQREFLSGGSYASYVLRIPEVKKLLDHMRRRFEDAKFEAALQRAEAAGRVRIQGKG